MTLAVNLAISLYFRTKNWILNLDEKLNDGLKKYPREFEKLYQPKVDNQLIIRRLKRRNKRLILT